MNYRYDTFRTAFGPFSVAVDLAGAVVATAFGDLAELRERVGPCKLMRDKAAATQAREEITRYLAGECRSFSVALAPRGSEFQQRVWAALQAIPFGETRSYGALAKLLGNPAASRAVGRANA